MATENTGKAASLDERAAAVKRALDFFDDVVAQELRQIETDLLTREGADVDQVDETLCGLRENALTARRDLLQTIDTSFGECQSILEASRLPLR